MLSHAFDTISGCGFYLRREVLQQVDGGWLVRIPNPAFAKVGVPLASAFVRSIEEGKEA